MRNLKIIYYETTQIQTIELENKLSFNQIPMYRIGTGLIVVSYSGTVRELYDLVAFPEKRMLIMDIKEDNAYWGYMQSNLWIWLKKDEEQHNML